MLSFAARRPVIVASIVLSLSTACAAPVDSGREPDTPLTGKSDGFGGVPTGNCAPGTEPVKIWDAGPSETAFDLVFVAEGYAATDLYDFCSDVERFVVGLRNQHDWGDYFQLFNVWIVPVASVDSGVDSSTAPDVDKSSAFGIRLDGARTNFQSTTDRDRALAIFDSVPADGKVVLINERANERAQYVLTGASPMFITNSTLDTADADPGRALAHELSHHVLMLSDEYGACAGSIDDARTVRTINLSPSPRLEDLPWADLVDDDTPLPSPPDLSVGTVGAFDHAESCDLAEGFYRPTHDCLMRFGDRMCPVCRRELDRFFDHFEGDGFTAYIDSRNERPCPDRWEGDGYCDLCFVQQRGYRDPDCE